MNEDIFNTPYFLNKLNSICAEIKKQEELAIKNLEVSDDE